MSEIKILKASAGSGKTYRITREYIELLFEDEGNYKHILAVTFTNKATEEMKTRILSELYLLANNKGSSYEAFLRDRFKLSPEKVANKAKHLLKLILYDYSHFAIETIDSFFQRIIRSFVRELGIFSAFTIELDQNRILQMGSDELLDSLDDNPDLKKWLLRFTEEKIESGRSWRLGTDIHNLGKEIFKEDYRYFEKSISEILSNKEFLNEYMAKLNGIIKKTEADYFAFGKEAIALMQSQSLEVSDFMFGKSGVAGFLTKISEELKDPGARPRNAIDKPEAWYKKGASKRADIETAVSAGLNSILRNAVDYYDAHIKSYNTATRIRENLYVLGILTELNEKIREYVQEKNLFMLSDSAQLLNLIIGGSDTPFVYEKTGTYFKHFMIDEFQDTSAMQWDNFKPLIDNSLSQDYTSLVVGDVKQSIYRWRNGDWKLLAKRLQSDFQQYGAVTEHFEYNWRSQQNIVHFNNSIFGLCPSLLQNSFNAELDQPDMKIGGLSLSSAIVDAYQEITQKHPDKKGTGSNAKGKVKCSFVDEENWEESALGRMVADIEQLQDEGCTASDMAILVRTKNEGNKVADYLFKKKNSAGQSSKYNYSFISDESLLIKSSLAVACIIAVLRHLKSPNELLYKAQVAYYHVQLKAKGKQVGSANFPHLKGNADFIDSELADDLEKLKDLPLFALTEGVIRLFRLNRDKANFPYLFSFQDLVFEFGQKEGAGIGTFLDWWDELGVGKSITIGSNHDAIRLLTIHKSKGLEFKAVLVPFCNWKLDSGSSKGNILWCRPTEKQFASIPSIPVKYSRKLKESQFNREYYYEKIHSYIDNLNVLYVAFTRAREVLISYSAKPDGKALKTVACLLHNAITKPSVEQTHTLDLSGFWDEKKLMFSIGDLQSKEITEKKTPKLLQVEYPSMALNTSVQLKSESAGFFKIENIDARKQKDMGVIMHELFAMIHYSKDIDPAVRHMEFKGKLSVGEANDLSGKIKNILVTEPFAGWFSEHWQVRTENSILSPDGKSKTPDRIMLHESNAIIVDYKFGQRMEQQHKSQLMGYKKLLGQMGYINIDCFLWYFSINKVIKL